jgi:RNA polymerase sporulation-specific sigma factor
MDRTYLLIERAHNGDKQARDCLVEENLGLVWSVVRRFERRGYEMEDLYQIGTIGLIKAIDKFDASYSVRLSTYAIPVITGEVKRFLRDDGMVKVSRSLKENGYRLKKLGAEFLQENGREPTVSELCERAQISEDEAILALESLNDVDSIYRQVSQSDGSEVYLLDRLADQSEKDELLDRIWLSQLLEQLDDTQRDLIRMRYFEDRTQTDIAKELGISQVQVSRMEKKILLQMRKMAGE